MTPLLADASSPPDALSWTGLGIGLAGGLALFLYGVEKISVGLREAAGDRLRVLLARLTTNRFTAVATGIVVTAALQSSSLATVLVVGFVSAGLLTLPQAVGVIMGANIGATLAVQIAAFHATRTAWLFVAGGFLAMTVGRRDAARQAGAVLMGLGLLFLALEQMTSATSPLRNDPGFLRLVARLEQPVWGVLAGAAITAVVQSSAATTGVLLALASQGAMTLSAALAMALGANLGSCVTAWIAAWRRPAEGRQAAAVHLMFNLLGVLGWSCFLPQLGRLAADLSDDVSRQIAHAHTIFNVANTLVLIWFTGPLARAAQWLIPARPGAAPPARGAPRYLDESLLSTPALALDRLRRELGHLGELVQAMLQEATPAVLTGSRRELQTVAEADQDVNALHRAVVEYVRRLARREMTLQDSEALEEILAAANELESAGDVISTNIVIQGCRRLDRGLTISPATQVELKQLAAFVETVLASAVRAFVEQNQDLARQVRASKEEFQKRAQATLETLRRRLLVDEPARSLTFQMEVDLVSQYQRLHFIARRLAKLVLPNSTAAPTSPAAD